MKVRSIVKGGSVYVDARDLAASIRIESHTISEGLPEREVKVITTALNIVAESIEALAREAHA